MQPIHDLSYLIASRRGQAESVSLPFLSAPCPRDLGTFAAVIATGDLQGRMSVGGELLGIAVARELALLAECGQIPAMASSLILLTGDLWADEALRKRGGTGDVMPVWEAFMATGATVLGVGGNHDAFLSAAPEGLLDAGMVEVGGLRIGGLSGVIGNPRRPMRRAHDDFGRALSRLAGEQPDWIVLHEPPHIGEGQEGQHIVMDAMILADYRGGVLCGHHWWENPVARVGEIWCCNVDSRVVVFTAPGAEQ